MAIICSVGTGVPANEMGQEKIKELVKHIFNYSDREINRLLPVFDHAAIKTRQFVVPENWFLKEHHFEERNRLYMENAIHYSLEAMDNCLRNTNTQEAISYEDIDLIAFVSSTGIATPSIETYLMNERNFRNDVERMPLWGLGCAGGAIGLSRVYNYLKANPQKTALLINCEICSLTFQRSDQKKSNLIGTALFGDGISAVLLLGEDSPYRRLLKKPLPFIRGYHSYTEKDTINIMGWNVIDTGFEVIFSKSIPALVKTIWKNHMQLVLQQKNIRLEEIDAFIAHPGGKKVMDAMIEALQIPKEKLKPSSEVLLQHGNMSSATVQYVLGKWLEHDMKLGMKGLLTALGPGFSSEILLLEWDK